MTLSEHALNIMIVIMVGVVVGLLSFGVRRYVSTRGKRRQRALEDLMRRKAEKKDRYNELRDAVASHFENRNSAPVSASEEMRKIESIYGELESENVRLLCREYLQGPSEARIKEIDAAMKIELDKMDSEIRRAS